MVGLGAIGDLFGKGSIGEQFLLWNVGSAVASSGLAPFLADLQAGVFYLDPSLPADPAMLADLVSRGFMPENNGADGAQYSGISGENFARMVQSRQRPPDLSMVFELLRRGAIQEGSDDPTVPSLRGMLTDSGIHPGWIPLLTQLQYQLPSWTDALNAWLQGQLTEDEARVWYLKGGGDPDAFQWLYDSRGASPTPDMLGVMANRGIIPWDGTGPNATSYAQGFLEGPWRNKWEPFMRKLAEYLPPPRTVTALIHSGVLTDAQALDLFKKEGLSPELAAAYVQAAHHTKVATEKTLTESNIVKLYKDKLITKADAKAHLEKLTYSPTDADYLLELADVNTGANTATASINRIRTLYTSRKMNHAAAVKALTALSVPAEHITALLTEWDILEAVNVKSLSPAQIGAAFKDDIMSQAEASRELQVLGYTAFDAWVILSIEKKTALPDKPAQGPNPVGLLP